MLKVRITHAEAWYKNHIGKVFEVEDKVNHWFGSPHYRMENTDKNGWTHKLIDCKHAEIVE